MHSGCTSAPNRGTSLLMAPRRESARAVLGTEMNGVDGVRSARGMEGAMWPGEVGRGRPSEERRFYSKYSGNMECWERYG